MLTDWRRSGEHLGGLVVANKSPQSKYPVREEETTTAQLATDPEPKRTDHVWTQSGHRWKCVLCGAVTLSIPPDYPTPDHWQPHSYEKLTGAERDLCISRIP